MHDKNSRLPGEGFFAILMAGISGFALWKAWGISGFSALSAPGTFPMAVAAVMLVASLVIVAKTVRLPKSATVTGLSAVLPWRVVFLIAIVIGYALAIQPLGFLPTSFLFLMIAMQVLAGGRLLRNAGIALLCLVLVYAVFRLLFSVLMPEGIVPEREIMAWVRTLLSRGVR